MEKCMLVATMLMLLGAARLIQNRRDKLKGTIKLVFQPAEEGYAGASYMLEEGALDGFQAMFGLHVWPFMPVGTISSKPGPIMAGSSRFTVLTVAFVDGGQAGNVIPESVRFAGTFRFMTLEGYSYLKQRIKEEYMSYSATVDFMEEMRPYPPTINDSTIYDHNQRVGEILFGNTFPSFDGCRGLGVLLATAFFFIGTQNKTISSSVKGLHSLYFTIDEEVLPIGAALHAAFAISYLDTHFKSRVTQ
uniref:IAA-amino acid hydrolase ILR1-like 7 n=1 Tax=Solanum tuberosum TaxID=4113 RepID=M0ZYK3_SOLTU